MSAKLNVLVVALAAAAGSSIAAEPVQPVPAAPAPAAAAPAAPAAYPWVVPDVDKLSNDKYGQMVRMGRDLVLKTSQFIGPEVADPAKRFAGNNLACTTCHLDGGTKKDGNGFVGTYVGYPSYKAREDSVQTIEERINGCMERSMNGRRLPLESVEMKAMTTYMRFMSTNVPVGANVAGLGLPKPGKFPDRPADPVQGKQVYDQFCVACHGPEGQGVRVGQAGDAQGYVNPPLWGADSYNDGAGMNRVIMAARFIRNNMPKGVTAEAPVLTDEQAFDVAAFINSQPRPKKAGLDADFPARINKVVDAHFPPYREGFTPEQHKYGPFKPIIDAMNKEVAAAKKK
ncbi:Cytochrome c [Azoarcus sp. Aa7]|nr:Cytochrome c [Azoarcus sp. Aa7]